MDPHRQSAGIAVVVPCRNGAPWLGELLDSLAAQVLPPDEVVVVDDGSTDGSPDVVRRWKSSRGTPFALRVIEQSATGLHVALARGVADTTSPLLARVDADDVVRPEYLARLADAHDRNPGAAYAYPVMELFGAAEGRYPTRPFDAAALVMEGNFVCGGALVRRSAYERCGGVADLPAWEDWDLWLRLLEIDEVGVLVDEPLYLWRRHAGSRNTMTLLQRRALRLRILWRHRALVRRYGRRGLRGALRRAAHPVRQQ